MNQLTTTTMESTTAQNYEEQFPIITPADDITESKTVEANTIIDFNQFM